jgi:predicted metal-binding membrane protein
MTPAWTERYAALVLVVMAAMMLPSAAPAILQLVGLGLSRPGRVAWRRRCS